MSTILIADSGSTKTRWAVIAPGHQPSVFTTPGINPVTMSHEEIQKLLTFRLVPQLSGIEVDRIYFYGAGCATEAICSSMAQTLSRVTGCPEVEVESDLLGAARALCGHRDGIACILGTGSNSCLFNGTDIVEHVSPLGFILGDEGSGAVIGRTLIGNILKQQLPAEITDDFNTTYGLTTADIISRVYRQTGPNAFLASFMPFVAKHIATPSVEAMVTEQFSLFIRRNLLGYTSVHRLPIHFTGSVAHHFAPQLHKAAEKSGLTISSIDPDPMPRLLAYHTKIAEK